MNKPPVSVPAESRPTDELYAAADAANKFLNTVGLDPSERRKQRNEVIRLLTNALHSYRQIAASSSLLPVRQFSKDIISAKRIDVYLKQWLQFGSEFLQHKEIAEDTLSGLCFDTEVLIAQLDGLPVGESRQQIDKAFEGMATDEAYQRESARLQGESTCEHKNTMRWPHWKCTDCSADLGPIFDNPPLSEEEIKRGQEIAEKLNLKSDDK